MSRANSVHISVFLLAGAFLTAHATADTIYVCWDGSGDYLTIQEGIGAAVDGDEVVVCDGTYTGDGNRDIDFGGRLITVRSINGPDSCIIDCQANDADRHRAFIFQSGEIADPNDADPDAVLEGFTITNGFVTAGGGVLCQSSSPTLINCTFSGNEACYDHPFGGLGGGVCNWYSSPTVMNCTFSGNRAEWGWGGGMSNWESSSPTVINCTFSGNEADDGGGMHNGFVSNPVVINCTFSGNWAGGMHNWDSNPTMMNCVLWGDSPGEISDDPNSVTAANYSNVEGGWPGVGNIDVDPLFVDPDGPDDDPGTWEDNDYRLSPGSPCTDAGDNTAVPLDSADLDGDGYTGERIPFDLDGNPRFVQDPFSDDTGVPDPPQYWHIVDMGAYEYQFCFGDLNGDNEVSMFDLAELLGSYGTTSGATYHDGDLDGDCDVDLADLAELLGVYGTTCE